MFSISKIRLRQVLAVGLVSIIVFLGSAVGIGQGDRALAEVLNRETDAAVVSKPKPLNDAAYESTKANRNRTQAEMSKQAESKAESEADSKSVAEKLNLGEISSPTNKDDSFKN